MECDGWIPLKLDHLKILSELSIIIIPSTILNYIEISKIRLCSSLETLYLNNNNNDYMINYDHIIESEYK